MTLSKQEQKARDLVYEACRIEDEVLTAAKVEPMFVAALDSLVSALEEAYRALAAAQKVAILDNPGGLIAELEADRDRYWEALEEIDRACSHDLERLTGRAHSDMRPEDRTRSIQTIARRALQTKEGS